MPHDHLNYPPELPKMASDLQMTALQISEGMEGLKQQAMDLASSSNSQSTEAFYQFEQEWRMTMRPIVEALGLLGGQVNTSYEDITIVDHDMGVRMRREGLGGQQFV